MSLVTLEITAQVYENYSETGEYWKPKGDIHFNVKIDCDELMYVPNIKRLCQDLLDTESNSREKFTYLNHLVAFQNPIEISTDTAMELISKQWREIEDEKQTELVCDYCGKDKEEDLDHCECYSGTEWVVKKNDK